MSTLIFRKPEQTKRNAIKDWHLMVFVSIMVLIDVVTLTFYTLLEALLDNFGTVRVPNKENPSAVRGVRWNATRGGGVDREHSSQVDHNVCL